MYKFRDTPARKAVQDDIFIPVSAMAYDGVFLEEYISGYQTLSVEGREMYTLDLETQDLQVGGVVTNIRYPSRQLTIKYRLIDRDPNELQRKFDKLLAFLIRKEAVKIVFNDDLDYYFKGIFQGSDIVSGDTNSIISTFTIYCSDPFKYGLLQTSGGEIIDHLPYAVKPEVFEVKMLSDKLDLTDGKYHLRVSSAKKDDVLVFDFVTGDIFVNKVLNNRILDFISDFKNIRLKQGSNFTSKNYQLLIKYRKAVL